MLSNFHYGLSDFLYIYIFIIKIIYNDKYLDLLIIVKSV